MWCAIKVPVDTTGDDRVAKMKRVAEYKRRQQPDGCVESEGWQGREFWTQEGYEK